MTSTNEPLPWFRNGRSPSRDPVGPAGNGPLHRVYIEPTVAVIIEETHTAAGGCREDQARSLPAVFMDEPETGRRGIPSTNLDCGPGSRQRRLSPNGRRSRGRQSAPDRGRSPSIGDDFVEGAYANAGGAPRVGWPAFIWLRLGRDNDQMISRRLFVRVHALAAAISPAHAVAFGAVERFDVSPFSVSSR